MTSKRIIMHNNAEHVITYSGEDSWIATAHLILAQDQYGTFRVMTMPEKYSVAKLITGYAHTSYKNGNTLDLRRENLCKPNYSRHDAKNNRSGHKYICLFNGSYRVNVYHKGKMYYGGNFADINDAISSRDKILKKLQKVLTKILLRS